MQATVPGLNRTGAAAAPQGAAAMAQIAAELTPPVAIDTTIADALRATYVEAADAVGSIPPATGGEGGAAAAILLDKIGERIAFERGGTRLYDALIAKYAAVSGLPGGALPPVAQVLVAEEGLAALAPVEGEDAGGTLARIRSEEQSHFVLLCEAMAQLGGDPTAQTPCADVVATASLGLMQVVTDPRTTLAQCLNAMLSAELTDNAGWELLIRLCDEAGETGLAGRFLGAYTEEQEHLAVIQAWLTDLVTTRAGTPAV